MIKEIYPFALVALIGAVAHILTKLAGLETLTDFSFKIWLKKNKFKTLSGLVLTILAIILLWSLKELNWASAILAGYTGDSIIKAKIPALNINNPTDDDGKEIKP
jgi:hypothetical protein